MLKVGRGAHAPPFLVMDTIAAANRRQAALPPGAPHVIRMEVGQPGTGDDELTDAVRSLPDKQRLAVTLHYLADLPYAQVAAELGATPTAVSIAWVLARRGVTSVIIGPRTFDQYEQNMEGFDLELDEATVKRLSDASRAAR